MLLFFRKKKQKQTLTSTLTLSKVNHYFGESGWFQRETWPYNTQTSTSVSFVFLLIFLFVPVIEIKQECQSPGPVSSHTGAYHQKQVRFSKSSLSAADCSNQTARFGPACAVELRCK